MCEHVTYLDKLNLGNLVHKGKAGQYKAKEKHIKAMLVYLKMERLVGELES